MRSTCIPEESVHHWNCIIHVTRAKEKEFKATFEIKGKALYSELPDVCRMMEEILTRSKTG